MSVWVLKDNHRARQFYEKQGGHLVQVEKEFKWNGQFIAMELAYVSDLKTGSV